MHGWPSLVNAIKLCVIIIGMIATDMLLGWVCKDLLIEFERIPKDIIAIVRYVHWPPILMMLTGLFFRAGPIRSWFLNFLLLLVFGIPCLYLGTCMYIIGVIFNGVVPDRTLFAGFMTFCIMLILVQLSELVPKRCPGCKSYSLIPKSAFDPRWKESFCVRCKMSSSRMNR